MESKLQRISITLEDSLLNFMDDKVQNKGYASRSEFIRDLIREKIVDDNVSKGEAIGVLSIIYDHHQRELSDKMNKIQHSKLVNIVCNLHIHLTHHECLEVIVIKAQLDDIKSIAEEIKGLKGVSYGNLSTMTGFEEIAHSHSH